MKSKNIPRHIAIVMDGNGRWARKRFMPRVAGHREGVKTAKKMIELALEYRIQFLTLFVFSSENWNRPTKEIDTIFQIFVDVLTQDLQLLHEKKIKLHIIGDKTALPLNVQVAIEQAESLTKNNTGLHLILAINYGGRWDIQQAINKILQKIPTDFFENKTENTLFTQKQLAETMQALLTTKEIPDPDLFIRTGGEYRISNFYLYQLAYAELYFTPLFWPDFNEAAFLKALDFFQTRERRYGRVQEEETGKLEKC